LKLTNGSTLSTDQTTFSAFDATVTTLNIGGAATTKFGGGYGSTGVSVSAAGNIQANGTLTVDSTSTLTGNVTATGDLAVNGGDITASGATNISVTGDININTGNLIIKQAGGTSRVGIGADPDQALNISTTRTDASTTMRSIDSRIYDDRVGTVTDFQGIYQEINVGTGGGASTATTVTGLSIWGTLAGSGSVTDWKMIGVANPSETSSGAITNLYGIKIDSLTTGTNNWSIYTGTADSYFGGSVGIGTTAPSGALHVNGGVGRFVNDSGQELVLNRTTNDGTMVTFQRDGTAQGTISVAGATVSYNAFTGSHYSLVSGPIEPGQIIRWNGQSSHFDNNPNTETVYGAVASDAYNAANVIGVYLAKLDSSLPTGPSNPDLVAAVGNADAWIVQGDESVIMPGDYLVSSSESGHLVKAADSLVVAHVIGRAAESIDWSGISDTVSGGKKHKRVSVLLEPSVKTADMSQGVLSEISSARADISQQLSEIPQIKSEIAAIASESASISGRLANLEQTVASASSLVSNQIVINQSYLDVATLSAQTARLSENLTVIGQTQLARTTIGGALNVGLLHFDDLTADISSLTGDLSFQGGKVKVTMDGDLELNIGVIAGNEAIRGALTLNAGQTATVSSQNWSSPPKSIVLTPGYKTSVWVENITNNGFRAVVDTAPNNQGQIYWMAIW
jgi:hypothetical protein